MRRLAWVSIPHRYAENSLMCHAKKLFIIVSIPHRYAENVADGLFLPPDKIKFQFLIGTLKTQHFLILSLSNLLVSIPHRYAENLLIQ